MLNQHLNAQLLTWTPRAQEIHADNIRAGWWNDIRTGQTLTGVDEHGRDRRNVGELLMLVVSELSEASEGYADDLSDDKLPHRAMIEVELADAAIRLFDIGGAHGLDFTRAALDLLGHGGFPRLLVGHDLVDDNLMTITNLISKAMESHRKGKRPDELLPHRSGFEVSLTAALLLIYELGWILGLDVDGAIAEKRAFNAVRPDHQVQNRRAAGGKTY